MLKNAQTTKFIIQKLVFVTALLVLEEWMELVKSALVEKLQLLMEHVEAVESTNNLLIVNAFVLQVISQMLLKSVLNVVM
mgnify:CR=1 FL=1